MSTVNPMSAPNYRLPTPFVVVTARAVIWIVWLLGILLWAPRVENVFQRLGVRLPTSASFVIALTHGLVPLGLLLVLVFIALDGTITYRLHQVRVRGLWSSFMTIAPLAAIFLTALALSEPMLRVLDALTR